MQFNRRFLSQRIPNRVLSRHSNLVLLCKFQTTHMQFPDEQPQIPNIYDGIVIHVDLAIQTSQNTTVKFVSTRTLTSPAGEFSFGGGKVSCSA